MADRAEELGLAVPILGETTRAKLASVLPPFGATANPIDVTGQFLADPKILSDSVRIALDDPDVHMCVIWLQLMHGYADMLVALFRDIKRTVTKPFVVCWIEAPEKARLDLMAHGICVIGATERAVDAAAGVIAWGEALQQHHERTQVSLATVPAAATSNAASRPVSSLAALGMLRDAGLTVVETRLARTAQEAAELAQAIGFPVAVKIESVDVPHKTEAGGVVLGLGDPAAVQRAFQAVTDSTRNHAPAAKIEGVLIQRMARPGY